MIKWSWFGWCGAMVAWDTCCECFPNLDFKGRTCTSLFLGFCFICFLFLSGTECNSFVHRLISSYSHRHQAFGTDWNNTGASCAFPGSQQALSIENDHIHDMFSHRMAACRRNSQMSGAPQYSPRSSTHAVAQVMPIPVSGIFTSIFRFMSCLIWLHCKITVWR
jgi:hypothetical protein